MGGDKVTVMENQAAIKARNELVEIQARLEALQVLQSKLNKMDGQVAALTPERASAADEEPDVEILAAHELPAARYVNEEEAAEEIVEMSAKERVLYRKQQAQQQKQQQYEADLKQARIQNAAHNVVASQRKKQEYGQYGQPQQGAAGEEDHVVQKLEEEYMAQLLEATARIDQLKTENGGYDDSDVSEEEGLSSDSDELSLSDNDVCESSGNLDARSHLLHKRCVEALGDKFEAVYNYLRHAQENSDDVMTDEIEDAMERDLENMVGHSMMGYVKLVEQLIFIEECLH